MAEKLTDKGLMIGLFADDQPKKETEQPSEKPKRSGRKAAAKEN